MKRKLPLCIALTCIATLIIIGAKGMWFIYHLTSSADPTHIPSQEQPLLNPSPQYFMTVQGQVDPALIPRLQLHWVATYQTNNPQCNVEINELEGVDSQLYIKKHIPITPDARGNYQLKIPLDKYMPGKCKWKIRSTSYYYQYKQFKYSADASTGISFSSKEQIKSILPKNDRPTLAYIANPLKQTWLCGIKACHLTKNSTTYFAYVLPNNKSHYLITVNFNQEQVHG